MRKLAFFGLFLLPVMILLPHLGDFSYQVGSIYSDLAVSHYPNALYLQRALAAEQTIPLWSPAILSGYPFAANPLSGLFYLPGFLAQLLPLPFGLNLSLVAHLVFGGLGMYVLLRQEGLSEPAALLGGLAFEAMPKLYSHLGAGHLTLVYAVCWTPWLLLAERKTATSRLARWAGPGAVLGVIALADVRWAAYAGLFWLAYSLRRAVIDGLFDARLSSGWWKPGAMWILVRLSNALFALLVSAPLLLPLAQYTLLSTRQSLTAQESLTLSLPPMQLFGLFYPVIGGSAEWVLYPGAVLMGLALWAAAARSTRRAAGFWLVGIPVTLLLALGANLPLMPLLAQLPGMDLLRVPARMLFLSGMCFSAAAAYGLDALLRFVPGQEQKKDRSPLVLFSVSTFVVLFGAAAVLLVQQPLARIQFGWGALFFLLSTAVILLARAGRLHARALGMLLLVISIVDLTAVNGLGLAFRSFDAVFTDGWQAAAYIKDTNGSDSASFRVYSPSYSLPQHVAAWFDLELTDGVDPLQLAAYSRFMEDATGVPQEGYSVTLPPFATANPTVDNRDALPDAEKLGLLGVKYIVSAFPIRAQTLVFEGTYGEAHIYRNPHALPLAWVQPIDTEPGKEIRPVAQMDRRPNTITVLAEGPGRLVLSEVAYPGWIVMVDGTEQEIETAGGLFRAVTLASGSHQVTFSFRPALVLLGLGLALLAWAGLAWILMVERKRHG